MYKLVTSKALNKVKNHFNCSSISGLYLENEGGENSSGSHFEKLLFGNEIMTGVENGNPVISPILLALMEDSGWY